MRVIVAEDDRTSRHMLRGLIAKWGYDVVTARDGNEAWEIIEGEGGARLALLDWQMPGIDGVEICRKLRTLECRSLIYVILLTVKTDKEDVVEGLEAGANDYVTKPCHPGELLARLRVGERVLELQTSLADRIEELQAALSHIKTLQGILPICMYCHKIRNDQEAWGRIEDYIEAHSDVRFSHGLCPDCMKKHYPEETEAAGD